MKVDSEAAPRASTSDAGAANDPRSPIDVLIPVGVAVALVVGVALRFWTRSDLWFDESLTVNISRLPLGDIPDALRQDGAPPLYYVLLHFWIEVFGIGDGAVRAFSGVLSIVTLPLAWFAGMRIGGRRVAWLALLFTASSPYAIRYATESRMYALVMLLVLAGYLALRRALERPSLGRLALVAVITALLAYTQYWSFYLLAVVGLGLLVRWRRAPGAEDRRASIAIVGAMVVGGLAFVPWIPTFLDQLAHTGTPWGDPRVPWSAIPESLIKFAGDDDDAESFVLVVALTLLPLLAVFGKGTDPRRIELDLGTRPAVRWEAAAAFGALLLGVTLSYVGGTAFEARYAAIVQPIFVLVVAFGVTVFLGRWVRAGVVVLVVVLGLVGGVRNATTSRTQAAESADIIAGEARPGDVVAYCPDQIGPDVSRLLRDVPGLVQVTFPDLAAPARVNWVDYIERVEAANPGRFAADVVRMAGPDHTVWYVSSPGYNNVEGQCEAVGAALSVDRASRLRVTPDDSILEFQGLTEYPPNRQ